MDSCTLWIVSGSDGRRASLRAPRRGSRVKVSVEAEALKSRSVYLLCRKGKAEIIVAASAYSSRLEEIRSRLGSDYLVLQAPVTD